MSSSSKRGEKRAGSLAWRPPKGHLVRVDGVEREADVDADVAHAAADRAPLEDARDGRVVLVDPRRRQLDAEDEDDRRARGLAALVAGYALGPTGRTTTRIAPPPQIEFADDALRRFVEQNGLSAYAAAILGVADSLDELVI